MSIMVNAVTIVRKGDNMNQIIVFEGGSESNTRNCNEWLRENPDAVVLTIGCFPMHEYYSWGTPQICNQWEKMIVAYKIVEGG